MSHARINKTLRVWIKQIAGSRRAALVNRKTRAWTPSNSQTKRPSSKLY